MIRLDWKKLARRQKVGAGFEQSDLTEEGCIAEEVGIANDDISTKIIHALFSEEYYLSVNQDVANADIDPFVHFMNYGWMEGRDPSPMFSVVGYLDEHVDVKISGINPLHHYAYHGLLEGRKIFPAKPALKYSDDAYSRNYGEMFSVANRSRSPYYAPENKLVGDVSQSVCVIAFYLPQFHPVKENDQWWGKGFTEWTNVSKAVPQFEGHYQPRLPGELGYYDLRLDEVLARQVELAKRYGIGGFCFHYYWFNGRRLLEKPLDNFLNNKQLDIPFCLCWANENWTRRWDGAESEILMRQSHSDDDNENVFSDISQYIEDPRYIKCEGKPVIIIYRPSIIPNVEGMIGIWRKKAKEIGLPGLYIIATNSFNFENYKDIGFDAICEFPPHGIDARDVKSQVSILNRDFGGKIYEYDDAVEYASNKYRTLDSHGDSKNYHPGVMLGWDNEARKPGRGHVFRGATPVGFNKWLSNAIDFANANNEEKFVFINAWNEWAEGSYLEPDRKFGYAYLSAVHSALTVGASSVALEKYCESVEREKSSDAIIVVHCFYPDLIEEICERILEAKQVYEFDVVVSVPNSWALSDVQKIDLYLTPVRLIACTNVGRDIFPFLKTCSEIANLGYRFGCKLHSKKSKHLNGGDEWRNSLYNGLLDVSVISDVVSLFQSDRNIGLLAPAGSFHSVELDAIDCINSKPLIIDLLSKLNMQEEDLDSFVGGSMFWFGFEPIYRLIELVYIGEEFFGPELGAIDGTVAHSFERVIPSFIKNQEYEILPYECDDFFNPYTQ